MNNKKVGIYYICIGATILFILYLLFSFSQNTKFHEWREDVDKLTYKSDGYIFLTLSECEKHQGDLKVSCDNVFNIAESKAQLIGDKIDGLVTCRQFYDKGCVWSRTGRLDPKISGAFYLDSQVPQIAPIFYSGKFRKFILPSGCVIKRSDGTFKFNGRRRTEFAFLNWSNLNKNIEVPVGKYTRAFILNEYIEAKKNMGINGRMSACLDYSR